MSNDTLPPLPEWSKQDDLGGLVPSEIRTAMRDYALAAIKAAQVEQVPTLPLTDEQIEEIAIKHGIYRRDGMNGGLILHTMSNFNDFARELSVVPPAPAPPMRELSNDEIVKVLASLGIDADKSKYGFPELQVGTTVPGIRDIVAAYIKAASSEQAAPAPQQPSTFQPRELITLNGAQLKDLLNAASDDNGPDRDTEITLLKHDAPFKSTEGDDMPAGIYFYWTEYPEEGIVYIPDNESVGEQAQPVASAPYEPTTFQKEIIARATKRLVDWKEPLSEQAVCAAMAEGNKHGVKSTIAARIVAAYLGWRCVAASSTTKGYK